LSGRSYRILHTSIYHRSFDDHNVPDFKLCLITFRRRPIFNSWPDLTFILCVQEQDDFGVVL
jgi:hypothetical protein